MDVHQRIGPYEIVREIGRGGMGVVYLAREPDEGTLLAIKVLPGTCTNDPDRLDRFRREAATVMKVRHTNIVPIYSVGYASGTWFIAMKYIEGTPFDTLIDDRNATKTDPGDGSAIPGMPVRTGSKGKATETDSGTEAEAARLGPPISWIEKPLTKFGPPVSFLTEAICTGADHESRTTEKEWVHRGVVYVEKIARALDYLHRQGIVHRDVKPGNIIIDDA